MRIWTIFLAIVLGLTSVAFGQDEEIEPEDNNARGIFQREQGDGFALDIMLKRRSRNTWLNVPPDTVFRNGDRVKIGLRSNFDGYLYIVNIGTSGTRRIMVPGPLAEQHSLVKGQYQQFIVGELAGAPGEERLYIISSPSRIEEFEHAIAHNSGIIPAPKAEVGAIKPVAEPQPAAQANEKVPVLKTKTSKIGVIKSVGSKVMQILGIVSLFSREISSEYSPEDNRTFLASSQGRLKGGEFIAFELILRHE